MLNAGNRVKILIEALPYIQRFHNKVIVVKYGGNAMANDDVKRNFARDVVLLKQVGMNPVIVHGGGPDISAALEKRGIPGRFVHGIRITHSEAIAVVESCLNKINLDLCRAIRSFGGTPVGLTSESNCMIRAQKLKSADHPDVDFDRTGDIDGTRPELGDIAVNAVQIPVTSPMGTDKNGVTYNVNADLAAAGIAVSLQAEKLILMTNTVGVLDKDSKLITTMSPDETAALIKAEVIKGGMLPKVKCAFDAISAGVHAAHVIDGRVRHALLLELLTNEGVGTLIAVPDRKP